MKFSKSALFLAAVMLAASIPLSGCNKTKTVDSSSAAGNSAAEESADITGTQPDPLAPDESADSISEDESSDGGSAEIDDYTFDEHGAVVLADDSELSDATLIAAAQALFESACRTEWNYTVGCPYTVDYNSYIENEFEWQFYKITDSDITSFADIEEDYYKVFSSEYPNKLAELYKEKDGAVYALCGERGSDLYYVESVITGITAKNDSEIIFTVENHYSGNDFTGAEPYSETEEFSAVIYDDGTMRAGRFTLPY